MAKSDLLSADEAALRLKVTRRTILRWARERKIESGRISRKVILFTNAAVESFLEERTVGVELADIDRPGHVRSSQSQTKQAGNRRSSGQTWKELRQEILSSTKRDKE